MIRKYVFLPALALLWAALPSFSQAQRNDLAPDGGTQAQATTSQSVVTLALAPLDRLLSDVNYVATAAESPQSGLMFGSMANAFTQGLDRNRPAGLMVSLVEGLPVPLLMLPVTDLNTFLKGLEAFVGPPDVDNDGTVIISVGPNLVFIKDVGGWAFAARDRAALDKLPADPAAILNPLVKEHSLSIQLNVQAVPPPLRQMAIGTLEGSFERALEAQGGDAGKEAGRQAARQQLAMMKRLIDQTEKLQLSWKVDQKARTTGFDVLTTAAEGSEMAQMIAELETAPTRFSSFVQADAAAYLHASNKFGPLTRKENLAAIDSLPQQIDGMLASAMDEGKIDAKAKEVIEGLVVEIAAIARDSISKGFSDVGAVVRMDEDQLAIAAAMSPVDGAKVEQLATKLKQTVEAETSEVTISLNQEKYAGVNLHEIATEIPVTEEEARKVFGTSLNVFIGTSPDAVFLGVGPAGKKHMMQAIDAAAQGPKVLPNPLSSQVRVSLLPIFEYAQSLSQNAMVDMVLQKLREYPQLSDIQVMSRTIPRGSVVQLQIAEGVLRAIGTAAQSARQQPQF